MVTEIRDYEHFKEVINGENVIINFYAEWCGPCRMISPLFDQLSDGKPGKFFSVDVDMIYEVDISAMPTFRIYSNGNKKSELVGANRAKLDDMVRRNM